MSKKPTYEELEQRLQELETIELKLKQAESTLEETNKRLSLALAVSDIGFWEYLPQEDRFYFDDQWLNTIGYETNETYFTHQWWWQKMHPESMTLHRQMRREYLKGRRKRMEYEYRWKTNKDEWIWIYGFGIIAERDQNNMPVRVLGTHMDITDKKESEKERERLIAQLQDALAQIKTIGGLLPICAYCKNIKDDQGYWNKLEKYIEKHSEATFSHSICQECAEEHFPNIDINND